MSGLGLAAAKVEARGSGGAAAAPAAADASSQGSHATLMANDELRKGQGMPSHEGAR